MSSPEQRPSSPRGTASPRLPATGHAPALAASRVQQWQAPWPQCDDTVSGMQCCTAVLRCLFPADIPHFQAPSVSCWPQRMLRAVAMTSAPSANKVTVNAGAAIADGAKQLHTTKAYTSSMWIMQVILLPGSCGEGWHANDAVLAISRLCSRARPHRLCMPSQPKRTTTSQNVMHGQACEATPEGVVSRWIGRWRRSKAAVANAGVHAWQRELDELLAHLLKHL